MPEPLPSAHRDAVVISARLDGCELATVAVEGRWYAFTRVDSRQLPVLQHGFASEANARFVAFLSLATHLSDQGNAVPCYDDFAWRRDPDPARWLHAHAVSKAPYFAGSGR